MLVERKSPAWIECPKDPKHIVAGINEVVIYLALCEHLREAHNA